MKLAVAATAPLGADVLERLADKHDDRVPAHAAGPPSRPRPEGRRACGQGDAERLGIPVRQDEKLDESFSVEVDTVVVVAYGALIPASLLDRALWLNVHPSLLPRWRGAAPIERAIMAGDDETGVSVIRLVEELDAGPIGAQRSLLDRPATRLPATSMRRRLAWRQS